MAKISPVSIKYNIKAKFSADGVVEKPDVIGAIFGQTEGLLGEDLELRELQKNGKIGRINVTLDTAEGKTTGEIEIPASLDKAETTIIAATLETIERIGPSDAQIRVEKIEDVRGSKREYVIARAKHLLEEISHAQPNSREMESEIVDSLRESRIQEYGEERLPAGPAIDSEELIIVEGRADVLNLLREGIKNVIAMNGTSLPETIKQLSKEKTTTLFIDGDRGGLLIAKGAVANAKIDFIAQAPIGREVEELSSKEIIASLRNRKSASDFLEFGKVGKSRKGQAEEKFEEKSEEPEEKLKEKAEEKELSENEREEFRKVLYNLIGTRGACLLDSNLRILKRLPASKLSALYHFGKAYALILDGTATNTVVKAAERADCKYLVAKNFAVTIKTKVNLVSV